MSILHTSRGRSKFLSNRPEATTAQVSVFIKIVPVWGSLNQLDIQTKDTNSANSFFLYATGRQHPTPPHNNRTEHHSVPKCHVIVCWTWTEANEMGETEL